MLCINGAAQQLLHELKLEEGSLFFPSLEEGGWDRITETPDPKEIHWRHSTLEDILTLQCTDTEAHTLVTLSRKSPAQTRLEEKDRLFDRLVAHIQGTVYQCQIVEPWKMYLITDRVEELTGYPAAEFIDDRVLYGDLIHPDDRDGVAHLVEESIEQKAAYELNYRVRHRSGHYLHVHERGVATYDDQGHPEYLTGLILDVDEHRKTEGRVEEANRTLTHTNGELKRLNEKKNEFLGILAHDLQNPLSSLGLYMDYIKTVIEDPDEEVVTTLENMQRLVGYARGITEGILEAKKLESQQQVLRLENSNLRPLLNQVVEMNRNHALSKHIELELHNPSCIEGQFDTIKILRAVDNLVNNAIKFSPEDKKVCISAEIQGDVAMVKVADQGPGFQEQDLEKIFEPFTRLSAKPTAGEPSTGLGLALTKSVVEEHGGKLELESRPGEGATFTIELPLHGEAPAPSGGGAKARED